MKHEVTTSEAYDVTSDMIRSRLGICKATLNRYKALRFLPAGKRIQGLRGLFFTRAQANKLIIKTGSKAPLFSEASDSPLEA